MARKYSRKASRRSASRRSRKQTRRQRGGGPKCTHCGSTNTSLVSGMQAKYHCNACGKDFINYA